MGGGGVRLENIKKNVCECKKNFSDAKTYHENKNFDNIITTASPDSSLQHGVRVRKRIGL